MICTYHTTGEQSRRMLKKFRLLTRPTPARQDALYPERGPPNSLYLPVREWPRLPSTARIERAQFHRARSASKEGTWPLPAQFFSILLGLAKVGSAQRYIGNQLVKRHLHASLPLSIFQFNLKRPHQLLITNA